MCKKLLSYLIVFSILYSDALWAGSLGSKVISDDEINENSRLTAPRNNSTGTPYAGNTSSIEFRDFVDLQSDSSHSDYRKQSLDFTSGSCPISGNLTFEDVAFGKKEIPVDSSKTPSATTKSTQKSGEKPIQSLQLISPTHVSSRSSSTDGDLEDGLEEGVSVRSFSRDRTSIQGETKPTGSSSSAESEDPESDYGEDTDGSCRSIPSSQPESTGGSLRFSMGTGGNKRTRASLDRLRLDHNEEGTLEMKEDETTEKSGAWGIITPNSNFPKLVPDWCKALTTSTNNNPALTPKPDSEDVVISIPPRKPYEIEEFLGKFSKGAFKSLTAHGLSWEHYIAMAIGAAIGGGTTYATAELYSQGILSLASQYNHWFIVLLKDGWLFNGIAVVTALDSIPRNVALWKNGCFYLLQKEVTKGDVFKNIGLAFLPSLIEPFALITTDLWWMNWDGLKGLHNIYATNIFAFSPILWLNSMADIISRTPDVWNKTKQWVASFDFSITKFLSRTLFYSAPLSTTEIEEEYLQKKLDRLILNLSKLTNDVVSEAYEKLSNPKQYILEELPELPQDLLGEAEEFLTTQYLFSLEQMIDEDYTSGELGKNISRQNDWVIQKESLLQSPLIYQEEEEKTAQDLPYQNQDLSLQTNEISYGTAPLQQLPLNQEEGVRKTVVSQSWYDVYEKITRSINVGVLIPGTFERLVIFSFIMSEIMSEIFGESENFFNPAAEPTKWQAAREAIEWTTAVLFGLGLQTGLEYIGTKDFFEMWWSQEGKGHESYPWARRFAKLAAHIRGVVWTVPVGILSLRASNYFLGEDWFENEEYIRILGAAGILSYLPHEFATQTVIGNESYNQIITTGFADVYNQYLRPRLCSTFPGRDYQEDWLIRYVKNKKKPRLKYQHPDVIHQHIELLNKIEKYEQ